MSKAKKKVLTLKVPKKEGLVKNACINSFLTFSKKSDSQTQVGEGNEIWF